RNRDGVDTLIPNENLIISEVINWSYVDRNVRVIISTPISYQDDPEQALALMLGCAYASPRVLRDPEPAAMLMEFGERGMEMQLRVWIGDPENGFGQVRSDINLAIWRAFEQAGITIPPPQRDLHIRNMPESADSLQPRQDASAGEASEQISDSSKKPGDSKRSEERRVGKEGS